MKSLPRRGHWLATIVCSSLLCGCGGNSQPGSAPGQPSSGAAASGRLFGVTFQNMNNPFFVDLETGSRGGRGPRRPAGDARRPDATASSRRTTSPTDPPAATRRRSSSTRSTGRADPRQPARGPAKKHPLIVVDAPAKDSDLVLCTGGLRQCRGGTACGRGPGQGLAARQRSSSSITPLTRPALTALHGFKEEIARYPDMKILDTQEGKGTTEGARPVMRDFLGRYPDLDAAFPINDPSALGSISALESAGKLREGDGRHGRRVSRGAARSRPASSFPPRHSSPRRSAGWPPKRSTSTWRANRSEGDQDSASSWSPRKTPTSS